MTETTGNYAAADLTASLYRALAKAQGAFKPIAKNREVSIQPREGRPYKFRYADMEAVLTATRPALSENGLAVIQVLHNGVDGPTLETILAHADGGTISSLNAMPRAAGDIKQYGASITYLRRYAYCALLCVAADDDLDEQSSDVQMPEQARAPAEPKVVAYPEDAFKKNVATWAKSIFDGKGTITGLATKVRSKGELSEDQRTRLQAAVDALIAEAEQAPVNQEAEEGNAQ